MSRLGKLPIELPQGVTLEAADEKITVKGPKGVLSERAHASVRVVQEGQNILVSVQDPEDNKERALWGLYWSLIRNMVIGVTQGYEKKLEINGVGYRAAVSGQTLTVSAGYSHQVPFKLPDGVNASVAANIITISGIDKQLVGETAARIRKIRKPEPYKGKGIKYVDETIRRKAGKTAGKK